MPSFSSFIKANYGSRFKSLKIYISEKHISARSKVTEVTSLLLVKKTVDMLIEHVENIKTCEIQHID